MAEKKTLYPNLKAHQRLEENATEEPSAFRMQTMEQHKKQKEEAPFSEQGVSKAKIVKKEEENDNFGCGESEYGLRMNYKNRQWNDMLPLVAWVEMMAVMLYALISVYKDGHTSHLRTQTNKGAKQFVGVLFTLSAVAILCGFMWTTCLKKFRFKTQQFFFFFFFLKQRWFGEY
ncbi:hypothetical protein RFI_16417 [Reticulomyxa filosa]|uniref:Uncharacterized protein n=1 Tax=Reticulomyxa filosa TaxID=46433 RepID=X6N3E1_RETFI|nr:hypothetical protein RFI_16417 [Reticulomyxa filosa]|eukprot:ETO20800.1 hypothetical protein RFI_16417 [Reticulomyxa filosa]